MADFRRRLFCSKWGIFAKSEIKAILCTQEVHGPDRKHVLPIAHQEVHGPDRKHVLPIAHQEVHGLDRKHVLPIVHQAKKCFVEIFYLLLKNKFCSGQHNK